MNYKIRFFYSFFFVFTLAGLFLALQGCQRVQSQNITQAPTPNLPTPIGPANNNVRTPLPPQTIGQPLPNNYEEAQLDNVMPGGSSVLDPFTYGLPGSPFGPGRLFGTGLGAQRCGPVVLPMSSQFADPGDTQACLIISPSGFDCIPEIDHDKPGVAITFSIVSGIFTNPPWTIIQQSASTVTIRSGVTTIRFTFVTTSSATTISKVEYL